MHRDDAKDVHYERLVIEAATSTFTLELHRRLTVIAGAGELERDGLIRELIDSLGHGRPGVHAEVAADDGTRYAIYRPVDGPHRVVDVERALDVTHRFRDADGRIDLLGRSGVRGSEAQRRLRLTETDLTLGSREDEAVLSLAHVDQGRLWDTARKVRDREASVAELADAHGGAFDDAEVVAEVERRHAELEVAREGHEQVRGLSFVVGAIAALCVLPVTALVGLLGAVPLLAIAFAATTTSVWYWRQVEEAERAEAAALAPTGADTYLAFQLRRVNGSVVDDTHRRQMVRSADALRAARSEWELLAGDVPVDWAVGHRPQIEAAAGRVRRAAGVSSPMTLHLRPEEATAAALSEILVGRLAEARTAGPGAESLPLLLDDPLARVAPDVKPLLLEQLVRASADQQVVYLTDDEDVAAWARVEALTGAIDIVEPGRVDRSGATERSGHGTA